MLLGMMLGYAIAEAAREEYTPTVTTTRRTTKVTYTAPTRTTIIYGNGALAHKLWDATYFYESMSNSELEDALDRAYRRLDSDIKKQIHSYKFRRTITSKTYVRSCEVEISINSSDWRTVYYEVH